MTVTRASLAPSLPVEGPSTPLDRSAPAVPAERLSRWVLVVAAAVALAVAFVQAPGEIVDDTKLPLVMSPLQYMANTLHLWNPSQTNGAVQSLSFGYLFPMGPFFALGHAVGVPLWCWERIWLALLLTVSFWGVVRLAEALRIGNPAGRILAGIAYTVAPIVVTWAATSAALLAVVLLPWVLVPLVRGAERGSPRRAAAASGVAVALMGGANATVVLATLPVAAIWLLTRQAGPRRRALMGWWVLAVVLACFWWVAALAVQSRYGYNYLPYTETSSVTTATASAFEAVRGASYWTDYFTLGGPLLPGAWAVVSVPAAILGTVVVSALGLAGLARRGIPERLFLVASLFVGVLVIAAGYGGSLGAPFSGTVQHLLQSPLSILRNVAKFSPDVALPLALGLAWTVSSLRWPRFGGGQLRRRGPGLVRSSVGLIAALALLGASLPFWQAKLYPEGGFSAIPAYWQATANWLDQHQSRGTALLVPGSSFADYTWGRPTDEPLSVLMSSSWSVRSLVPMGSNGNDEMMDAVEQSLDRGVATPGLAPALARAGIDYVVERNDLDLAATGAPPPAQVHQVLEQTSGLRQVAAFGPLIALRQASPSRLPSYDGPAALHLRSVEVFRVLPASPVVRTYSVSDPIVLSGSPASLPALLSSGLAQGRASTLTGDPDAGSAGQAPQAVWVDTDGNQRRQMSFGSIRQNVSYVLGPDQQPPSAPYDVPLNLAVVPGSVHETVADPLGAASVSASSYGSSPLSPTPSEGPAAAFDADPATAWVADDQDNSVGQWVRIDFGRSLSLHTITVAPLRSGPEQPTISEVRIATAAGSVERHLSGGSDVLSVAPGKTTWLQVTLTGVRPARKQPLSGFPLGAGITSISIPGVHFVSALRLPSDAPRPIAERGGPDLAYSFSSPLTNANIDLGITQSSSEMVRRFSVPHATSFVLSGVATPVPGPALAGLIPSTLSTVQVAASSSLDDLPRYSADNLLGSSTRPWIAGFGDSSPTLTFHWATPHQVSSVVLNPTPLASQPRRVQVVTPSATRTATVGPGRTVVTFPPVSTTTLSVRILSSRPKIGRLPASGLRFVVPVGLASVQIPGLGQTATIRPDPAATFSLPCGSGPALSLDGRSLATSVSGTVGDLEDLRALRLTVCGGPVPLARGPHVLAAAGGSALEITSLTAVPPGLGASHTKPRTTVVESWNAQDRSVRIGPGPASYLDLAQNFNSGWKATLDGHTLTAVRLDGWQQAWVVPAGAGGVVSMTYAPDTLYHVVLAVGALLLVLLGVLALVRRGRRDQAPLGAGPRAATLAVGALGLVVLVLVGGLWSLAVVPLTLLTWRYGRDLGAVVAGVSFLGAGIAVALSAGAEPASGSGAFGPVPQALTLVALAAVVASLVVRERPAPVEMAAGTDGDGLSSAHRAP